MPSSNSQDSISYTIQINSSLIEYVQDVIHKAKDILLNNFNRKVDIKFKPDASIVTNIDIILNTMIVDRLRKITPRVPIVSEESINMLHNSNGCYWLVDPIDGTINYIRGSTDYTINISLIVRNEPILGFISHPASNTLYYTDHNYELNIQKDGTIIQRGNCMANNTKELDQLVAVVSPSSLNNLAYYFLAMNNIRQFMNISSSIKLCWLALGKVDICLQFSNSMEWNIAAGHALLKATGGDIFDLHLLPLKYGCNKFTNPDFIACRSSGVSQRLKL